MIEEARAGLGQAHGPGGALQEKHAEPSLEPAHEPGDGRGREPERAGCGREAVAVGDRDEQLSQLILTFKTFVSGLKDDSDAILDSLDQISALSVQTADLVQGIRSPFVEDIKQLRRLTKNINRNKAELDRALQVLPIKLEKVGRTAIYGSFFNFYLCNFQGKVRFPGNLTVPVNYNTGTPRCDLG